MTKTHEQIVEEKLETLIGLLKNVVALELYKNGINHRGIAKRLRVHTLKVGEMLRGIKIKKQNHE